MACQLRQVLKAFCLFPLLWILKNLRLMMVELRPPWWWPSAEIASLCPIVSVSASLIPSIGIQSCDDEIRTSRVVDRCSLFHRGVLRVGLNLNECGISKVATSRFARNAYAGQTRNFRCWCPDRRVSDPATARIWQLVFENGTSSHVQDVAASIFSWVYH